MELYGVTSCDADFKPTFAVPVTPDSPITLQSSTLASQGDASSSYEYILGANTYHFYESTYGGFEGHYKSYAWGATSTCGNSEMFDPLEPGALSKADTIGVAAWEKPVFEKFRETVVVNTFVETAPFTAMNGEGQAATVLDMNLSEFRSFPLGPSTTLVRSVSPNPPS